MKILIILTLSLPFVAFSKTCDELSESLLNIEYELQSSQMYLCSEDNPSQVNCRFGESNNETYAEVLQEYNKAMAKLVLHNGIEAITAAMEGSHNSLANLTPEKLTEARAYIDVLEESLTKAEVLEAAMTPVAGDDQALTSFWSKYNIDAGTSREVFVDNLNQICFESSETLCQMLIQQNIVIESDSEVIQTLHAFMLAEVRARVGSGGNPESFYNEQKEKLKISVPGEESSELELISASDYRTRFFGENGDMAAMRAAVTILENNPNDIQARRAVMQRAVALDTITTSYAIPAMPSEAPTGYDLTVDGTLNRNLQKPLIDLQMDLTDTFTTDIWETNLRNNVKRIKDDQAVFDEGLALQVKNFTDENMSGQCDSYSSPEECIRSKCGLSTTVTSCQDENLRRLNVTPIITQMSQASELSSLGTDFESAINCYDQPTFETKKTCLIRAANQLGYAFDLTAKQGLMNNLEAAKAKMERFNSASPFFEITEEKILAIAELENADCMEQGTTEYSCSESGDVVFDAGAIELARNLGNVSISLNRDLLEDRNRALSSTLTRGTSVSARDTQSPSQTISVRSGSSATGTSASTAQNRNANAQTQINSGYVVEQRGWTSEYTSSAVTWNSNNSSSGPSIGNGIMRGLTQPNPVTGQTALSNLIGGTFGYFQTKSNVKNFRSQIAARSQLYDAQQAYLEANRPPYSDVIPYYGGYIHNGYAYDKNFQAQAAQGNLYAPTANPLSFNFQTSLPVSNGISSAPVVAPGSVQTPLSTPSGSTTFSFDI